MKPPRGLSAEEAEAWARVAQTVRPLNPPRDGEGDRRPQVGGGGAPPSAQPHSVKGSPSRRVPLHQPAAGHPTRAGEDRAGQGLDSHWDRRFRAGSIEPDFTLDLHGHTLDQAHDRLIDGVAQARAMGARVVLLIAGRPRPAEAADRASKRGAIRAKVLDWLAASSHGAAIASIRSAHIRHGGEGALYLVLKRAR